MDNSREVLDELNNVNNPSSIHTYDFSTLYTNLPLDLVRNELFEMIDRYFDINERKSNKYIVLNHFWKTAQFASVNRKGSYDRDKLKTALNYLALLGLDLMCLNKLKVSQWVVMPVL